MGWHSIQSSRSLVRMNRVEFIWLKVNWYRTPEQSRSGLSWSAISFPPSNQTQTYRLKLSEQGTTPAAYQLIMRRPTERQRLVRITRRRAARLHLRQVS